jgi:23S rRNA (adenine2503-C2)-methyltransferase
MQNNYFIGKNLTELQQICTELNIPKFTAKQIAEWLYVKRARDFSEMTNISLKNRELLNSRFSIGLTPPSLVSESSDGTKKYLFGTSNGAVESVYIPENERHSLCISCQVGCKMNCRFCMTGKMGFSGNLSANEIINQLFMIDESNKITNLVFMGMGEPFDNVSEILAAVEILTSSWGLAMSPRRITVSSVGLISGMREFLDKTACHLAISLHNPFGVERQQMIPAEKAFPIEKIVAELRRYDFAHQRRISFEYIMFDGINDTPRHALGIVKLLKNLPCRINLIRFHAAAGLEYRSSNQQTMENFRDYLSKHQMICTIRRSRGEDIAAACGQLTN